MILFAGVDPGTTKSCGIVVFDDKTKELQHFNFNDPLSSPLRWIREMLKPYENVHDKRIYIEDCVMGYRTKSSGVNSQLDAIVKTLLQDYPGSKLVKKQEWMTLFKGIPAEINPKSLKPTKYIDIIALAHLRIKIDTVDWSEHERSALCIMIQGISQSKMSEYYE